MKQVSQMLRPKAKIVPMNPLMITGSQRDGAAEVSCPAVRQESLKTSTAVYASHIYHRAFSRNFILNRVHRQNSMRNVFEDGLIRFLQLSKDPRGPGAINFLLTTHLVRSRRSPSVSTVHPMCISPGFHFSGLQVLSQRFGA